MAELDTTRARVILEQCYLEMVRQVLARQGVTSAHGPLIFGSRATGQARRYSDLDLGFAGEPLAPATLARIADELEESDLPFTVDVVDLTRADARLAAQALGDAVWLDRAKGTAG